MSRYSNNGVENIINSTMMKQFQHIRNINKNLVSAHYSDQFNVMNKFKLSNPILNDMQFTRFNHQIKSLTNIHSIFSNYESIANVVKLTKSNIIPEEFSTTLKLIKIHNNYLSSFDLGMELDIDTIDDSDDLSESLIEINEELVKDVPSKSKVVELFRQLPEFMQALILWVLFEIASGVFQTLLLQPMINHVLNDSNAPLRSQINQIRKLIPTNGTIISTRNRFISGHGVKFRSEASIKSTVIDTLKFGQLVYVIEKHKSWSKVAIPCDNDKHIEGWVFTEYTKTFKN